MHQFWTPPSPSSHSNLVSCKKNVKTSCCHKKRYICILWAFYSNMLLLCASAPPYDRSRVGARRRRCQQFHQPRTGTSAAMPRPVPSLDSITCSQIGEDMDGGVLIWYMCGGTLWQPHRAPLRRSVPTLHVNLQCPVTKEQDDFKLP